MVTAPGIEADSLARRFGSVQALRDASFVAPAGAVTALIGPNGSGKTTLMLILASLLAPDSGTVRIAGYDPAKDRAAVRSAMGWMPDVLGTWAGLTSRTGLEITGRLHGLDRGESRLRSEALLDRVGLTELADQPARVLSRGQKQRLSLARALIHQPSVLLLDEPASGLDPAARVDLRTLVRELAAEGRTILVSSHVLAELDEMADDAVYMTDGETVGADRVAQARTRMRVWRVKAVDQGELRAAFARIGLGPEQIREDHQGLLVPVRDDADAAALLRRLLEEGAQVVSFAAAVGDLERTFLDLTGASMTEGEPSSEQVVSAVPREAPQNPFQRPPGPGSDGGTDSGPREEGNR